MISYSCRKCHHPLRGPEPREAAKHGKPSKATSIITNPNEIQLLRPPVLAAVTRETFYTDILSNLSMSPPVPLVTMLHLCLNSCQLFCITEFMPVFHPWTRHTRLFWLTHHRKCRSLHPGLKFLDCDFYHELVYEHTMLSTLSIMWRWIHKEMQMDHIHPCTHFSRSGKWQNISSLSLYHRCLLHSLHQFQAGRYPWSCPSKKPALASLSEFLYLLQSALLPAATDTIDTLYTPLSLLNSASHVFELNVICHFMHEHHGTLFSFLRSALDLAL